MVTIVLWVLGSGLFLGLIGTLGVGVSWASLSITLGLVTWVVTRSPGSTEDAS